MMTKELLQQALDALKGADQIDVNMQNAIIAIEAAIAQPEQRPVEPTAQPCPNKISMGEHACLNRAQCWEPCGELGHSDEHAAKVEPATQPADTRQFSNLTNQAHGFGKVEPAQPESKA